MITEQATVTRCVENRIELQLQRQSACGHCELSQGCGTGALGRLLGRRTKPLILENPRGLKAGDSVVLGLSERALVQASLLLYGMPVAAMILTGLAASLFPFNHEGPILLVSMGGFFAGYKLARQLVNSSLRTHLIPWIIDTGVNPGANSGS